MTIGASTNAVDIAGTNRGPVVHFSRENNPSLSALPTQAGEMAGLGHVDAVVSIPKAQAIDGHELGSTDFTSLRHPPKEGALPSTSLIRPAPTTLPYVLPVPPVRPAPYTFRLLQQWEGTVSEIAQGEFTAELRDLTDPANYREEATFDLDEVSPGDQTLLALGAVFRWSIGYKTSDAGQRERVSQIRFVRIPGWRKSAVEEIDRRAAQLQERFPLT